MKKRKLRKFNWSPEFKKFMEDAIGSRPHTLESPNPLSLLFELLLNSEGVWEDAE